LWLGTELKASVKTDDAPLSAHGPTQGAGINVDEYESEDGATNGVVLQANRTFGSFSAVPTKARRK
jgi:hypothetical protein